MNARPPGLTARQPLRAVVRSQTARALAVALSWVIAVAVSASPFTPADDDTVVERLPAPLFAQERAEPGPEDLDAAIALARRHIQVGRAEADPRLYGRAQGVLRAWWHLDRPPVAVRVLRGVIHQARHEFDEALVDFDAVLADDPENAQAWLSRALVLLVRGERSAGRESCSRLQNLTQPLVGATCLAMAAQGRAGLAAGYARLAHEIERVGPSEPELRQWALSVLGELAMRRDDPAAASAHLRNALDTSVRSVAALAGYADLLLETRRPDIAVELLRKENQADGLLLRLALAARAADDPAWHRYARRLAARFEANRARGSQGLHLREEARAELNLFDRPARALSLALANWRIQREPQDARIVLEAALATGDLRAANVVLRWYGRGDVADARLDRLVAKLASDQR